MRGIVWGSIGLMGGIAGSLALSKLTESQRRRRLGSGNDEAIYCGLGSAYSTWLYYCKMRLTSLISTRVGYVPDHEISRDWSRISLE